MVNDLTKQNKIFIFMMIKRIILIMNIHLIYFNKYIYE
jgi:cell division protein FtsL